jgi:hypothetical protein
MNDGLDLKLSTIDADGRVLESSPGEVPAGCIGMVVEFPGGPFTVVPVNEETRVIDGNLGTYPTFELAVDALRSNHRRAWTREERRRAGGGLVSRVRDVWGPMGSDDRSSPPRIACKPAFATHLPGRRATVVRRLDPGDHRASAPGREGRAADGHRYGARIFATGRHGLGTTHCDCAAPRRLSGASSSIVSTACSSQLAHALGEGVCCLIQEPKEIAVSVGPLPEVEGDENGRQQRQSDHTYRQFLGGCSSLACK